MSAIQRELSDATGVKAGTEARTAFLDKVLMATSKLDDKAYDALSDEAVEWFNGAMDVKNENIKNPKAAVAIPDFPDYKEPEAAKDEPRRRRSAEPEKAKEPQNDIDIVKAGDNATVTSARGKQYTGEVVEITDEDIVVLVGADEIEVSLKGAVVFINEVSGAAQDQGAGDQDGPQDPQVGDTVTVVNSRDKTFTGEIVEITDDDLVLDVEGKEVEFSREKLKSVSLSGASAAGPARTGRARSEPEPQKDEAPAGRRRAASTDAKDDGKAAEADKPQRSSNPKGVSIGGRVRELMAEDPTMTQDAVMKQMRKEGLNFRDSSVDMIYKDCSSFLSLLKAQKRLK